MHKIVCLLSIFFCNPFATSAQEAQQTATTWATQRDLHVLGVECQHSQRCVLREDQCDCIILSEYRAMHLWCSEDLCDEVSQ